jgi:hypothetical protein
VLGLAEDAPEQEIQRAYRQRVKQTHPDRGGAAADFRAVVNALDDLRRHRPPRTRTPHPTSYDRWLSPCRPKGAMADSGPPPRVGPSPVRGRGTKGTGHGEFAAVLHAELSKAGAAVTV